MIRDRLLFGRRTKTFTLQWHLTNACELRCSHCYDRSHRKVLTVDRALAALDEFEAFCGAKGVAGNVCLTGGNPFLYPHFMTLYQAIAGRRMPISILGNAVTPGQIRAITQVAHPTYFQVSLEGLRAHNDSVRGAGHFDRTVAFLPILRTAGIRAHVMLTLTKDNIDQVVPLADYLRDRADRFTFNRLSQAGTGESLDLPDKTSYIDFLRQYSIASRENPVIFFKDGLFNIFRYHFKRRRVRGCTGFGCGAAFNFVALLPDGEVHACRKFPSRIGAIGETSFKAILDSPLAKRYRKGTRGCSGCPVRTVCGGCMAVVHGSGKDVFRDRDPFCFMKERAHHCAPF